MKEIWFRTALVGALLLVGHSAGAQTPPSAEQPASKKPGESEAPERLFLGAPSSIVRLDRALIALESGIRIYSEPDLRSVIVLRVDVPTEAELLSDEAESSVADAADRWRRVRIDAVQGWLAPSGSKPLPLKESWTHLTSADEDLFEERLHRIRERFGEPVRLAAARFFTDLDVDDHSEMLEHLGRLVSEVSAAYARRYRLEVPPDALARTSVVLFSRRQDYEDYLTNELDMPELSAAGVSPVGLAILSVEGRSTEQVSTVLIHEIVHLLNRDVFASALPQWLEEGLAEEMSYHPLDSSGRIRLGELPRARTRVVRRIEAGGLEVVERHQYTPSPRVAIACASKSWPARGGPDLEVLTALTPNEFAMPEGRSARYAESALLVRYLLDGGEELLRQAFLRRLRNTVRERSFELGLLLEEIDRTSDQLSREVASWARRQVRSRDCPR